LAKQPEGNILRCRAMRKEIEGLKDKADILATKFRPLAVSEIVDIYACEYN
jgi:hypothetical protein